MEQTYFRKGFGLKREIAGTLAEDYHSQLVDSIRRENGSLSLGGLTIRLAKEFEVSTQALESYDFWHGYSLYYRGMAIQTPETVETATRSLPIFQQALGLFQRGKGYADRTGSIPFQQYIENIGVYIEIQEAIIKRGQRGQ